MTYAEKLKHPEWQKKRLKILERDQFTCQLCDSKDKTLHVHHKFYISGRNPWEYTDGMFMTLCHECHESNAHSQEKGGVFERCADLDHQELEALLYIAHIIGTSGINTLSSLTALGALEPTLLAIDELNRRSYDIGKSVKKS